MNYRSVSDLAEIIRRSIPKVPTDVDLIVGVPRSGLLAANLLALNLNLKFSDVQGFVSNAPLKHGCTREVRFPDLLFPQNAKHVLVIDDSIDSGKSLQGVRSDISQSNYSGKCSYAACFAAPHAIGKVDLYFEMVPQPRFFEWNIMHRPFLLECCIDIDGVLCVDPTTNENDDGPNYKKFLLNAQPLIVPSCPLGILVTSRLEKYRPETEEWLKNHGFIYKKLEMLDLPDAKTRRRLGVHASFKADIFRKESRSKLFIESDPLQAREIARLSGKNALSYSTQEFFDPQFSYAKVEYQIKKLARRIAGKVYRNKNN